MMHHKAGGGMLACAARMPMVVASWNSMLIAPRCAGGAIWAAGKWVARRGHCATPVCLCTCMHMRHTHHLECSCCLGGISLSETQQGEGALLTSERYSGALCAAKPACKWHSNSTARGRAALS